MRRMFFAAALVLCCSVVSAAPPSCPPELVTWYDTWHDPNGTLVFRMYRQNGVIIPNSWFADTRQCGAEIAAVMNDPSSSAAAKRAGRNYFAFRHALPCRFVTVDIP